MFITQPSSTANAIFLTKILISTTGGKVSTALARLLFYFPDQTTISQKLFAPHTCVTAQTVLGCSLY